jgi:hypothetical protein
MGDLVGWAFELADEKLAGVLPRRWAHVQGVGRRARVVAPLFSVDDWSTPTQEHRNDTHRSHIGCRLQRVNVNWSRIRLLEGHCVPLIPATCLFGLTFANSSRRYC